MERVWEAIAGAALGWNLVEPNDRALATFDAGEEWYAREMTEFVRQWAVRVSAASVNAYQFGLGEEVVGYAFATIASGPHPHDPLRPGADYYTIMALALDFRYRGSVDVLAGRRNVDVILDFLGLRAREASDEAVALGCAGLLGTQLLVYAENTRARCAYERNGFLPVAGNPVARDRGEAIRLWRPFGASQAASGI
jgi:GNAT superfamily N-acetyltransferase